MKFLFLYSNLRIGGVQTLILRMAKWLSQHGHSIHVFVADAHQDESFIASELRRYASIDIVGVRGYQCLQIAPFTHSFFRKQSYDVVHAFDPIGLWIAAQLSKSMRTRFVAGIYHPQYYQFKVTNLGGSYYPQGYEDLISALPDNVFLFMNEATLNAHAHYYNRSFSASRILPIPIENKLFGDNGPDNTFPQNESLRVVSVGRFVDFKRYPIGVMDAISALRKNGHNVVFELYGKGPLESEFKKYAQRRGFDFVRFMGVVPYQKFAQTVRGALAFAGMGTAVLEAAAAGVPSLVMPVYSDGDKTLGYLHEQKGFNLGEEGKPRSTFGELERLCHLSFGERLSLGERERRSALKFSVDEVMPMYLSYVEDACVLPADFELPSIFRVFYDKILLYVKVKF
ncbi:MAG: glycosyltransferase [Chloroflexi bacterium]|nr:MAG: glycosyltransferase [Chloroflexota bacterium]